MTNNNQQIDLNAIYGLDKCQSPPCEIKNPSMVNTVSYKPSLEQIASYVEGNRQPVAQSQMQNNQSQNNIQGDLSQMYQPITPQQAAMYPTPAVVAAENQGEISQGNNENADMSSIPLADLITDFSNPYPVTRESIQYLNGFIRTQIGRRVSIDFLIGSNTIETKSGYLLAVAANYILINELDTNDVTACDFYNIKFIRFYY